MPNVCFYFQVHQPYRIRPYGVLDIGSGLTYFDEEKNRLTCQKVAEKCYLPANRLLLELIKRHQGRFKIAYSISGVALDQFAEYTPEVLTSFKELAATGHVEFLAETYYHSLASIFDADEFREQVQLHLNTVRSHFKVTPTAFRNTELIYSNHIAKLVEELGFRVMLTEGADHVLHGRSPNWVYAPQGARGMKLLLKNYKLSDDLAFRFSERRWPEWPLTPEKFAHWVHTAAEHEHTVNLFMDYETFGEHQWADTGIFEFLEALPNAILAHPHFRFATPSMVAREYEPVAGLDIPTPISWADIERDLSAWIGNPMQDGAIAWVYKLGAQVKVARDPQLLDQWRRLQTSDHFYYMCTKFWADGDVHKYFSCYDTPHEAYVYLGNVLADLELRLAETGKARRATAKPKLRPSRPTATKRAAATKRPPQPRKRLVVV